MRGVLRYCGRTRNPVAPTRGSIGCHQLNPSSKGTCRQFSRGLNFSAARPESTLGQHIGVRAGMRTSAWRILRFGSFEANLQAGELRKQGLKVRLQDQPFQILAMLLERQGELVTRQEIHPQLWPADTFVDFDHGLNNAINRLREALCDCSDTPLFIETIPRRGYRLIAAVTIENSPARPVRPIRKALKQKQHRTLIQRYRGRQARTSAVPTDPSRLPLTYSQTGT